MMRCGIVEDNEALLARFFGGLNKKIQTILRYKSYHTITRLFHLACNAECEVQDRREATRTNFSTGRSNSWRTSPSSSRAAAPSLPCPHPRELQLLHHLLLPPSVPPLDPHQVLLPPWRLRAKPARFNAANAMGLATLHVTAPPLV